VTKISDYPYQLEIGVRANEIDIFKWFQFDNFMTEKSAVTKGRLLKTPFRVTKRVLVRIETLT
jgi:hypothetical protein